MRKGIRKMIASFNQILSHIADCRFCSVDNYLSTKLADYWQETEDALLNYKRQDIAYVVTLIHAVEAANSIKDLLS
jgi:hypothetical protein